MSQIPSQRHDDGTPSPALLLPVLAYAERYPRIPIFTIVECLLATWRDASLTYVDDAWMASFDRLASARLAALSGVEAMDSPRRSDRRDRRARRTG